jgi:hypothetical protein
MAARSGRRGGRRGAAVGAGPAHAPLRAPLRALWPLRDAAALLLCLLLAAAAAPAVGYTVHVSSRARNQLADVRTARGGHVGAGRGARSGHPVGAEAARRCGAACALGDRALTSLPMPRTPLPPVPAPQQFVRTLPLRGDALDAMSEAQRSAWAADLRLSAGATLEALTGPQVAITVDVKLVGFDGDGCAAWGGGRLDGKGARGQAAGARRRAGSRASRPACSQPAPLCPAPLCSPPARSNHGLSVADHELQTHLRSLHSQLETVALGPRPTRMVRRWQQRRRQRGGCY